MAEEKLGSLDNYNSDSRLMKRSAIEIKHLRTQNELMGARLKMFDDMLSLFKNGNRGGEMMGMVDGMDLMHHLEERSSVLKVIESLHPEMQSKLTSEALDKAVSSVGS